MSHNAIQYFDLIGGKLSCYCVSKQGKVILRFLILTNSLRALLSQVGNLADSDSFSPALCRNQKSLHRRRHINCGTSSLGNTVPVATARVFWLNSRAHNSWPEFFEEWNGTHPAAADSDLQPAMRHLAQDTFSWYSTHAIDTH